VDAVTGRALGQRTNDLTLAPGDHQPHASHPFADLNSPSRSPA
jgi:hypothetical protein